MKFRNEYYFLSNMYAVPVNIRIGQQRYYFTCAEAAFQALKCPPKAHMFTMINNIDGYTAKRMGKCVPLRPDWDNIKLLAMAVVLKAKFTQNPSLMPRLQAIQEDIIEENTWNDTFWGQCRGEGQNYLGRLLMQVRDNPSADPETWVQNL